MPEQTAQGFDLVVVGGGPEAAAMEEHRHDATLHHHGHLHVRSAPPYAADSTSYALLPARVRPPM
jgi:hypothetical protein